ncbi:radical SAM protein [Echinicola jeungdonensis]|uniref:Radical SAM/SPASM domain-containing protein n=1 Tax=Echinicola jeungdonensis TaxID=709343 RepID=A0ABV5J8L6_9BACT|nr:radical SAM protein [Echinicola jeungdonensis]MDN3670362.1 radical SAM protein [Echinicola jeungdonensis]
MKTKEIVQSKIPDPRNQDAKIKAQKVILGFKKELVEFFVRLRILRIVFRHFQNPVKVLKILKTLDSNRRKISGPGRVNKFIKINGRYFWNLYIPGSNSLAFDRFFEAEINRISPIPGKTNRFSNIFIAFTKKCPLKCEHCFEWDVINKKEKLGLNDIQMIIKKFQLKGVAQFQITGGEPMLRVDDIVEMIQSSHKGTDFWVLTSGFNLTYANAQKLKQAGLTGVVISLDHFDPESHNLFRGFKKSYQWVEEAVRNSIASSLVTALSICVTKTFVSESNLMRYAELAKKLGVSFVQILEPKALGHYSGKDVQLAPEQEKILEEFYLKMNFDKRFRDFPIITYHGYYQRRVGCFGAGNRHLYIDTDGDLHPCPFCFSKTGNALDGSLDDSIAELQAKGCHSFNDSNIR